MRSTMKVLILGGTGAVGRAAATALRRRGHEVIPSGRTLDPGEGLRLDLGTAEGRDRYAAAAMDVDAIVNASGIEDQELRSLAAQTAFIDTSAGSAYLDRLATVPSSAPTVLGAGIAPGVSTLLAAALDASDGDDVDIAVVLGTGEHHGPAAVAWTAALAGADVHRPAEGHPVRNLREQRRFPFAGRNRLHLRADFPDHVLLPHLRVRSYLSLTSPSAVAGLALVGRFPALRGLLSAAPHWGDDRWQVTAAHRRSGRSLTVGGYGQSTATGEFAALAAERAVADGRPRPGAVPLSVLAGTELLAEAATTRADWATGKARSSR